MSESATITVNNGQFTITLRGVEISGPTSIQSLIKVRLVKEGACCEHPESEHETVEYRGDKPRYCLAKDCECKRFHAAER